ncbi:nicotinate mononucleotide-dependent phosphoribosyltransferase CobT [Halocatena pleomorpha]|uniref:UPF0284 protein EIK79_02575 n=1 Tax=Halocatena pleomorpha TaxID=1785090 RepID=A0A3P3RJJ2_9EURY|nr:TIGR00303 family protein [Halocatena pleomorpha]RRJ33697.1 TIGR00303 family protein [Halocatena pleomorpha]
MKFVFVAGNTETARIDGISAAGATPAMMVHTPSADLEIVTYGQPVRAPVVPVSPSGCPTPAVVTRAVYELVGFEQIAVDAGLARPTSAPTVSIGVDPGQNVRESTPVPAAAAAFKTARELGRQLPDEKLIIGETIPGGTTTALGVLTALGERPTVSSSLPENPLELKQGVIEVGLNASGLSAGDTAGDPTGTLRCVGDPVLATVGGLAVGATESGTDVTLAGGTQMAAAAALVRHAGVDAPLSIATTVFIVEDESAAIKELVADLSVDMTVTDPGFDQRDHQVMDTYLTGEAKEGVGMGGALALADQADVTMAAVREQIIEVYDRLLEQDEAE